MDNLTPWKEALKERTLYGCFVTYGLPDIAEVTALMGFDFLLLDNEHGVIGRAPWRTWCGPPSCGGCPRWCGAP